MESEAKTSENSEKALAIAALDESQWNVDDFTKTRVISSTSSYGGEAIILDCGEKKFEFWLSQNKLVPPWEFNWFQLPDNQLLLLRGGLLKELVEKCVEKAGNLNRVCKAISLSYPSFVYLFKGNLEMVSVRKLRKIARYLGFSYDYFNDKIIELRKGTTPSIQDPLFPINLSNTHAGEILGAVSSDGCVYVDSRSRGVKRTKYSTDKAEDRDRFKKNVFSIFGKVHFNEEEERNCTTIRIGTSLIGTALIRVGAICGHKAKLNRGMPWIVKEGSKEIKAAYLRVAFGDEGSIALTRGHPYIVMTRARQITDLIKSEKMALDELVPLMKSSNFPTGHQNKAIQLRKATSIILETGGSEELIKKIMFEPRLLYDESSTLSESFGIINNVFPSTLHKTQNETYSSNFTLAIQNKDGLAKFASQIGFSSPQKQEKLVSYLKNTGW